MRRAWSTALHRILLTLAVVCTALASTAVGAGTAHAAAPNRIWFNGRNIYLNGVNAPWGSTSTFGTDLGCNYDANRFETMFSDLQTYGVNAVRFWVHVDGRCSPTFTSDNTVSGASSTFYSNLDDLLNRAKNHNVAVLLTLWAPELTFNGSAWTQIRPVRDPFINDASKTQTYIDNVLVPMARRYDSNPALLGYEVINEPEFAVSSSDVWGSSYPTDRNLIQLSAMQRFVAQQVVALHRNTTKYVNATGSASYKWNAAHGDVTVGNWWSDDALKAQVPDADKPYAYSDFYQVHWYDWEKGNGYDFSPWENRGPSFYNDDDKPVIIGEMPAKDDTYFTEDYKINESWNEGYLGSFAWSYSGIDGYGSWNDVKDRLKAFHDAHAADIDLNLSGGGSTGGGGNARNGSHGVQLAAAGGWRNFGQFPSVSQNSTYTASIWVKGSGTAHLEVDAGQWGARLGEAWCTGGGSSWSQCSVTVGTGGNSQVTWRVSDSTSGGTLYFDDASLDNGSGNVVDDPGLENNSGSWFFESPFSRF
ncbi:cellulase family glycosylhydrolase [Streptacidiphilus sp. ASG 303]|uniref:cellulase family glycosylhydrolase n=1 Tax=Streptacidiphilus sp. ASG 303 TaxID=2896847 RepID=UPI001E28F605|nr:cellulase family glycosylhydrolase [Streptacidiphilus sp. ASG 303]MCD0483566.1 cellulase family glycosylhydrolase [Streptacidiphilus sp. ASG 303]